MNYQRPDGVVIELLKIHGTKQQSIKYALKLVDAIFIDKQDLQNINVKKADEDPRIEAIQSMKNTSVSDWSIPISNFFSRYQTQI